MKVAIHSLGTRGDVQPYLALAGALGEAGHEALLVAPAQFATAARQRGIPFVALPAAFLDLMHEPEVAAAMAGGRLGWRGIRALLARYRPIMEEILRVEAAAADAFRPDIFVYHPKALGAFDLSVMTGAIVLVHGKNGFNMMNHGFEYNYALIMMSLALIGTGPGPFTIGGKCGCDKK